MLHHDLRRDQGILILQPEGALRAEDFASLAGAVDPYLEQNGELKGIVVDAPAFPGWENFAGLVSHLRFVRDHHRHVRKIAVVTGSAFPGWENFAGLVSHLRFVRDHHRFIRRIAVVTGSAFLSVAPKVAGHFVGAEVKVFEPGGLDAALAWITAG